MCYGKISFIVLAQMLMMIATWNPSFAFTSVNHRRQYPFDASLHGNVGSNEADEALSLKKEMEKGTNYNSGNGLIVNDRRFAFLNDVRVKSCCWHYKLLQTEMCRERERERERDILTKYDLLYSLHWCRGTKWTITAKHWEASFNEDHFIYNWLEGQNREHNKILNYY